MGICKSNESNVLNRGCISVKLAKYLFFSNLALNEVTEGLQCACSRIIYHLRTQGKLKENKQRKSRKGSIRWGGAGKGLPRHQASCWRARHQCHDCLPPYLQGLPDHRHRLFPRTWKDHPMYVLHCTQPPNDCRNVKWRQILDISSYIRKLSYIKKYFPIRAKPTYLIRVLFIELYRWEGLDLSVL